MSKRKTPNPPRAPRVPKINCLYCNARVAKGSTRHFFKDSMGHHSCKKRPEIKAMLAKRKKSPRPPRRGGRGK